MAIIGILVAISIPIFTSQLAKAKLATNQANARAAKAAAVTELLLSGYSYGTYEYAVSSGTGTFVGADSEVVSCSYSSINEWKTESVVGENIKAGDEVVATWKVSINGNDIMVEAGTK